MTTTLNRNGQANRQAPDPTDPTPWREGADAYRNQRRRAARRRHRATDALMRLLTDHERLTAQEAVALRLANSTRRAHLPPYQDMEQVAMQFAALANEARRLLWAVTDGNSIRLNDLGGCGQYDCAGCALVDLANLLGYPRTRTSTKEDRR